MKNKTKIWSLYISLFLKTKSLSVKAPLYPLHFISQASIKNYLQKSIYLSAKIQQFFRKYRYLEFTKTDVPWKIQRSMETRANKNWTFILIVCVIQISQPKIFSKKQGVIVCIQKSFQIVKLLINIIIKFR